MSSEGVHSPDVRRNVQKRHRLEQSRWYVAFAILGAIGALLFIIGTFL
jgi:hypothetical protein